jgi:hypothetical protein
MCPIFIVIGIIFKLMTPKNSFMHSFICLIESITHTNKNKFKLNNISKYLYRGRKIYFLVVLTSSSTLNHTPCLLCSRDLQWYTTNWQSTVKLVKSRGKAKTALDLIMNFYKKKRNLYNKESEYIHSYIPLTLYPLRGSRGVSDIPPRHPRFTKISAN